MPREFTRADRVADAIQRFLSQAIAREVRDPRIGMVNINAVSVTRDMAYAKVYVSFVSDERDPDNREAVAALNKAAGFLRTLLAGELSMRSVPRLNFIDDKTSVRGQELSSLIDRALADDRARQQQHEDPSDEDNR